MSPTLPQSRTLTHHHAESTLYILRVHPPALALCDVVLSTCPCLCNHKICHRNTGAPFPCLSRFSTSFLACTKKNWPWLKGNDPPLLYIVDA